MTSPARAAIRQLWVLIWRIRLTRRSPRASRRFADLGEWFAPEDLRTRA